MTTLVHSPALACVDPASHKGFVLWGHKIVEWATHDGGCRKDTIIGAILDIAVHGKTIEDKQSARGLGGKMGITIGSVGEKVVDGKGL